MVREAIARARQRARPHIESLYDGVCDVYRFSESYDPKQHRNRVSKEILFEALPCRVSISGATPATTTETVATKVQTVTLFCAPEHEIPAGSVIEATQAGRTTRYEASGQPRVYPTHQEISLTLAADKA